MNVRPVAKKARTPNPPGRKKAKTPAPPTRVQAPSQRVDLGDIGARQRWILYGSAAFGIIALVAVVLVFTLGAKGSSKPSPTSDKSPAALVSLMTQAGCSLKTVKGYIPPGESNHVPSLTKKLPWNTDPPSNGQHYPLWAVWGFYTQAVNPRMVVHDEEHGGVIYWWGTKVPASTVDALRNLYNEQPVGTFGTPYPKLGTKVAISAWTGNPTTYRRTDNGIGHLAICPSYTAATHKAFQAFRDDYRGEGPEGIPLDADKPGCGPNGCP